MQLLRFESLRPFVSGKGNPAVNANQIQSVGKGRVSGADRIVDFVHQNGNVKFKIFDEVPRDVHPLFRCHRTFDECTESWSLAVDRVSFTNVHEQEQHFVIEFSVQACQLTS